MTSVCRSEPGLLDRRKAAREGPSAEARPSGSPRGDTAIVFVAGIASEVAKIGARHS